MTRSTLPKRLVIYLKEGRLSFPSSILLNNLVIAEQKIFFLLVFVIDTLLPNGFEHIPYKNILYGNNFFWTIIKIKWRVPMNWTSGAIQIIRDTLGGVY